MPIEPEKNFLTYALYVMFFPQLVAGPIERPEHLHPQLRTPHVFSYPQAVEGLRLMLNMRNGHPEIEVEAAVVRNVVGRQYGLEFLRIHSQEKEQLGKVIEHHLHSRPMQQARLVS